MRRGGRRILAALDQVATSPEQLEQLLAATRIELGEEALRVLNEASEEK